MPQPPHHDESLWWLAVSPGVWIAHFCASYGTAAIYCAKLGWSHSLATVRIAIAVYSAVALVGVVAVGVRGFRRFRWGASAMDDDRDTPEARFAFLGFATLLLSTISAIGIVFVALPAAFLETCR